MTHMSSKPSRKLFPIAALALGFLMLVAAPVSVGSTGVALQHAFAKGDGDGGSDKGGSEGSGADRGADRGSADKGSSDKGSADKGSADNGGTGNSGNSVDSTKDR